MLLSRFTYRELLAVLAAGAVVASYAACTADELGSQEPSGIAVATGATTTSGPGSVVSSSTASASSGSGGVGGTGGATMSSSMSASSSSAGGMGGMPPLLEFKATAPDANGLETLPMGMTITSAAANRTAQTGAATLRLGFAANAARAQSRDGQTWGLMVENTRTNYQSYDSNLSKSGLDPDGLGWISSQFYGSAVQVTGKHTITDPSGAMGADEVTWTDFMQGGKSVPHGFFGFTSGNNPGNPRDWTMSFWLKWASGSGHVDLQEAQGAGFPMEQKRAPTTSWGRVDGTLLGYSGAATISPFVVWQMDSPAKIDHFGAQLEIGRYPTSLIPTGTNKSATRQADVVAIDSKTVMPDGYFDATIVYAPAYADGEVSGDHVLLFVDGKTDLRFRQADKSIALTINAGAPVTVGGLTFDRWTALTVHAKHSAAGVLLEVSGAKSGNGSAMAAAQPKLTPPATIYLLGDDKGAQEASDLRQVDFE